MPIIGNVFVSPQLFNTQFTCDYASCKGVCCEIEGSGAPLLREESQRLSEALPDFVHLLAPECRDFLQSNPFFDIDQDNILSLACLPSGPCVFDLKKEDTNRCAIDHLRHRVTGHRLKPVSCRLFPLRVRPFGAFLTLEYERWEECRSLQQSNRRLIDFTHDALVDRFGPQWVMDLLAISNQNVR